MIKSNNQNKYILSIDPAGIGATGVVLYDIEKARIVAKITYRSDDDEEAVEKLEKALIDFKQSYQLKNPICIIEKFNLRPGQYIKNPLSTPMAIGGAKLLLKKIFKKPLIYRQEPKNRMGFEYHGSIKLTKHEHDAWKHIQYFLEQQRSSN